MKWIDRIEGVQFLSVLINDTGRELACVTATAISSGKGKHRITGHAFMIGRSTAGVHSDFLTARGICERIIQLRAQHGRK